MVTDWKTRNIRYLRLKESSKERTTNGPMDSFFSFLRKDNEILESWEIKLEKAKLEYEQTLKEIILERKYKGRKKRLELYKKCKRVLLNTLIDCKDIMSVDEEEEQTNVKKIRKQERTLMKMKKTEENHSKLEDEDDDEEDLKVEQKSLPIVFNIGMCLLPDQLDPNIVARTVDLVCGKPHKPSRPAVVRKSKFNVITKPQQHKIITRKFNRKTHSHIQRQFPRPHIFNL